VIKLDKEVVRSLVYKAFEQAYRENHYYDPSELPDNILHVSELTYCARKAFYQRRNPRPLSREKTVILSFGNAGHYFVEEYLEYPGLLKELVGYIEVDEFEIHGQADLVLDDSIAEIKTVSRIPEEPFHHHLLQLNAYLKIFERSKGFLIYIDKRRGIIEVFEHTFDNNLWRELIERARRLYKALKENKEPEPEFSPLCRFCEFKDLCGVKEVIVIAKG